MEGPDPDSLSPVFQRACRVAVLGSVKPGAQAPQTASRESVLPCPFREFFLLFYFPDYLLVFI